MTTTQPKVSRRNFLGFLAAPAIVKATSLMPVRGIIMAVEPNRDFLYVSISLGYAITRKAIDDNLYNSQFARLKPTEDIFISHVGG